MSVVSHDHELGRLAGLIQATQTELARVQDQVAHARAETHASARDVEARFEARLAKVEAAVDSRIGKLEANVRDDLAAHRSATSEQVTRLAEAFTRGLETLSAAQRQDAAAHEREAAETVERLAAVESRLAALPRPPTAEELAARVVALTAASPPNAPSLVKQSLSVAQAALVIAAVAMLGIEGAAALIELLKSA